MTQRTDLQSDILCKLTETETRMVKVPPVIITEPRNDPTSNMYKKVRRFLARRPEYYRGLEMLPVERPKWKLAFEIPPKLPIIIGKKIEDTNGNPLQVILVDANTGEPSVVPKVLQIELVPLLSNFPRDCWDADDFQRGVMEDPEGQNPLLAGEYVLTMWHGRSMVKELMFTDECRKYGSMFRIGVRVVPGMYHGVRILEAMTEAFMVRDSYNCYELHSSKQYKWQLTFHSQPPLPIYTGGAIRDKIGNPLEVILVDTKTGLPSALGMELQIQLVLLSEPAQSSCTTNWSGWSADEFRRNIVRPAEGEGPILSGDVSLTMTDDGRITVNELLLTESSSVIVDGMYRIGVRVVPGSYYGAERILDGITRAFTVKDRRSEMSTKLFDLDLRDDVWRITGILWGGEFHKRLTEKSITNVQDFLRILAAKPEELRAIMGDVMEDDNRWKEIMLHARSCIVPIDKVYIYSTAHTTIHMSTIYDLVKAEFDGRECLLQELDEAQKMLVQQTVREAYENPENLREVRRTWKLAFKRAPRLPIHTGSRIVDATGNPLEIVLVDAETGSSWPLPMELHIELVPILGDFPPYNGQEYWSAEEFQMAIVTPRQNCVPLLKSFDYRHIMWDGCVTVSELQFTDDSSLVRCGKFRIGAHVVLGGTYDGTFRIVEAMTEPFVVEDLNRKHYPPILRDPIWRLEMIDKDGEFHWKLTSIKVDTVQEFLRILHVKLKELRATLVEDMNVQRWIQASFVSASAHLNVGINYCISLLRPVLDLDLTKFYRGQLPPVPHLDMTKFYPRQLTTVLQHYFAKYYRGQLIQIEARSSVPLTNEIWHMMTNHAMDCDPEDKVYVYRGAKGSIYVDSTFYLLFKFVIDGVECPLGMELDMTQMMRIRQLILEAYEHRQNLQEIDVTMDLCYHDTIEIPGLLSRLEEEEEADEEDNVDEDDSTYYLQI